MVYRLDEPTTTRRWTVIGWGFAREYRTNGQGLNTSITRIENTVDNVFNNVINRDAIVTYTTNGTHSPNSLHYDGTAIDLRTRDMTNVQIQNAAEQLRTQLGNDYDVIVERDRNGVSHIHIEYDPRNR